MADRATSVVQHVEQCLFSDSPEIRESLKAIEHLNSVCVIFKDVELFLFRPEVNVLLNLVGLHYCMHWLEVPAEHVMEVLQNSEISQRQMCVKWWELGRLFYGFRMRDESHSRSLFLQDLALPQENKVLSVLHRGAIHEAEHVMEVLQNSEISQRQVCVKWWELGRLFYGFRMRDESHSRSLFLQDLALPQENKVLSVLHRGAIHEAEHVMEVLQNSEISQRQVCVKWWELGRLFYGFRMRDESHSHSLFLQDLALPQENEVLSVLHRGAIHEAEHVMEVLQNSEISQRQVCVKWWELGRLFYGFRMRDESHSHSLFLQDLALPQENEVLSVLHRGAIHEVLRIQISVFHPACTSWSLPERASL